MNPMSEAAVEKLRHNKCPVCGTYGLIPGPRGGAGQNVYCADPGCRAAFIIAPRDNIAIAYRMGKAPENYYVPQVHIVGSNELPLCNFAGSMTVDNGPPPVVIPRPLSEWPIGHAAVGPDKFEFATCKACRARARS